MKSRKLRDFDGRAWRLGSDPDHIGRGRACCPEGQPLKAFGLSHWQAITPRLLRLTRSAAVIGQPPVSKIMRSHQRSSEAPPVTRRCAVALLGSAAASAAVTPAASALDPADPFLAIWRKQLEARKSFEAACEGNAADQFGDDSAQAAAEAEHLTTTCDRYGKLSREACYVMPTTAAGVLAFIEFMRQEVYNDELGRMAGESGDAATAASWKTLTSGIKAVCLVG